MARLCEGRVAIVTGGARGVGREHCLMLAEHGAKVFVVGPEWDATYPVTNLGNDLAVLDKLPAELRPALTREAADDVPQWDDAGAMLALLKDAEATLLAHLNVGEEQP